MGKYYAVKKGRKIGIYNSWDECLVQVNKYKGAQYKSFISEDEAKRYLGNENKIKVKGTRNIEFSKSKGKQKSLNPAKHLLTNDQKEAYQYLMSGKIFF